MSFEPCFQFPLTWERDERYIRRLKKTWTCRNPCMCWFPFSAQMALSVAIVDSVKHPERDVWYAVISTCNVIVPYFSVMVTFSLKAIIITLFSCDSFGCQILNIWLFHVHLVQERRVCTSLRRSTLRLYMLGSRPGHPSSRSTLCGTIKLRSHTSTCAQQRLPRLHTTAPGSTWTSTPGHYSWTKPWRRATLPSYVSWIQGFWW